LPNEFDYVDGSFALTANDPEFIKLYNKNGEITDD
jgi:hypothetical protein